MVVLLLGVLAEFFQGTKLQLLDCALTATEILCDLAKAALLNKTAENDAALVLREQRDQLCEERLTIKRAGIAGKIEIVGGDLGLTRGTLPALREQFGGNAEQPSDERRPLPLEAVESGDGLMEDLGGEVLGFLAGGNATRE